jgi:hypothetical protein
MALSSYIREGILIQQQKIRDLRENFVVSFLYSLLERYD